jgi:uncharacterized protein involved in exopolysaccharide biosynthesis
MLKYLKDKEELESKTLFEFIYAWRKPIVILVSTAMVIAMIVGLLMKPKYESTVIMFPVASNSVSKALLDKNALPKHDIMQFGEEEQAEQMLQILNSGKIRDRIIAKYNLSEHYRISEGKHHFTKLIKAYKNNVSFHRTKYMAVRIDVLDEDPVIASNMANDIADLLDSIKNSMQQERAKKAFEIVQKAYFERKAFVRSIGDSLTKLRKLGIHDYQSQSEMINRQLAVELAKGNARGIEALEAKLDTLAKYGSAYVSLSTSVEFEEEQLSLLKAKYEEAKIDAMQNLPQKFIVDKAFPADSKSYPIIWLMVLISGLVTFFLIVLIIAVIESIEEYNKKKVKTVK